MWKTLWEKENQHFLLFLQCFEKLLSQTHQKVSLCGNGLGKNQPSIKGQISNNKRNISEINEPDLLCKACCYFKSLQSYIIFSIFRIKYLFSVYYNVQSLVNKVGVLISDFSHFDIVSFTETCFNDSVSLHDLLFPIFHQPERKDRILVSDRYGGVILYVKDTFTYTRRHDVDLILSQMTSF